MLKLGAVERIEMKRVDLRDWVLSALAVAIVLSIMVYFGIVLGRLSEAWRSPGSPELYFTGIIGALFLLLPLFFSLSKRTSGRSRPPTLFVVHVVAGSVGVILIAVHTAGVLHRPPALLFGLLIALVGLGFWARIMESRKLSGAFGTRKNSFTPSNSDRRDQFAVIIENKQALLANLDSSASEGTFSVTLAHCFKSPFHAFRYLRLVRAERKLLGTGGWLGTSKTYMRRLHIFLAYLFLCGLLLHVFIVTVFPKYAARGGPVTWWHL